MRAKRLCWQSVGVKKVVAMAGGVRLFCHLTAEFCMAVFAFDDRSFLASDLKSAQTA